MLKHVDKTALLASQNRNCFTRPIHAANKKLSGYCLNLEDGFEIRIIFERLRCPYEE
jgi:hypothetical protein